MGSIIMDVTTLGLDSTIKNLQDFPGTITAAAASVLEKWYNNHYKKTVLNIIKTGDGMAKNRGLYAAKKGTTQALGMGILHGAVSSANPVIKETRGKEIRFSVVYNAPFYLAYVHDGFTAKGFATGHPNSVVPARPFIEVARSREMPTLFKMMGDMFEGLDLALPRGSTLGPKSAPSLRSK